MHERDEAGVVDWLELDRRRARGSLVSGGARCTARNSGRKRPRRPSRSRCDRRLTAHNGWTEKGTMPPPGLMDIVLLLVCGVATGAAGAVLGTGGGVFLIPILLLGFHVPMHNAVGTSILTVVATSTAVAIGNLDRGTANMRLGMTLEIATSIGALSGGMSAALLPVRRSGDRVRRRAPAHSLGDVARAARRVRRGRTRCERNNSSDDGCRPVAHGSDERSEDASAPCAIHRSAVG